MDAKDVEFLTGIATAILSYCAKNEIEREKLHAQFKVLTFPVKEKSLPLQASEDLQLNINHLEEGIFKEEEIEKMLIEMPGISINKKMRKDNRFQGYVTINGEKNYVYGKTRTEVADKIKYLLKHGPTRKKRAPSVISGIPQTMDGFVNYFFEKFRRRKVAPKTFEADLGRYRKHIKPRFGNKPIKKISPGECQDLIDNLFKEGKGKTAEEVFFVIVHNF